MFDISYTCKLFGNLFDVKFFYLAILCSVIVKSTSSNEHPIHYCSVKVQRDFLFFSRCLNKILYSMSKSRLIPESHRRIQDIFSDGAGTSSSGCVLIG